MAQGSGQGDSLVRYAEKEDLPHVYVMYLAALSEIGEEYEEAKALDFMLFCWSKAPCVLLESEGKIIAFAGLNTSSPAYGSRVFLTDYMFYIQPAYRGIKTWRTLCKAVQEVADKFKLTFKGTHRLEGDIKHHERLIRMAGAVPRAIISTYGDNNG